jgi:2-methylcitrate dehydratase PrpD
MIHPYIDCARRLGRGGIKAEDIDNIVCDTGEGLVHRLWEPLASKHRPPSGYAAKFSMPFCMALGFFEDAAGLEQFNDSKVKEPHLLALAQKITYHIDPDNAYPQNYSGHLRVTLKSGKVLIYDQPHMRGGMREPLHHDEIVRKFLFNAAYGGWADDHAKALLDFCETLNQAQDLSRLAEFRR